MADFSALAVSCGESLLSMPMTSNFTPAGLRLLKCSAKNWKLLSWFWPTGAIRPDSGSIQAILTVSPFCAKALPQQRAASAMAVLTGRRLAGIALSPDVVL